MTSTTGSVTPYEIPVTIPANNYCLSDKLDMETLVSQLEPVGAWRQSGPEHHSVTFFDTFDWRLYRKGRTLEQRIEGKNRSLLILQNRKNSHPLAQAFGPMPRFVHSLPSRALREQLAPVVEMRALFPIARADIRRWSLECLNANQKITLRLYFEKITVHPPDGGASVAIPGRLRLLAVKGYPKPANKVRQLLQPFKLNPAEGLLTVALGALGLTARQYTSKLDIQLDPNERTGIALPQILGRLLNTLETNEAGTRADLDSEFLHDFRVSVRRTRAMLSQTKGVMPDAVRQHFRKEFAWLGQVTGPTRDLDVYLLTFPEYQASVPVGMRKDLEPLRRFLEKQQGQKQRALVRVLSGRRYRELLNAWREWLGEQGVGMTTTKQARKPIGRFAGQRISTVFSLVLREGEAINGKSPATDLHDLRKICKKLRYLMEFFQSLYPAGKISILIKALKALQDNLGNFQDLAIQADAMRSFAATMLAGHHAPVETVLAMGTLSGELLDRQQQYRSLFSKQFRGFASPGNRELGTALFGVVKKQGR